MNINPVSYENKNLSKRCNNPVFTANQPAQTTANTQQNDKADEFLKKIENMSPAAIGLTTAAGTFAISFAIDRLLGAAFKFFRSDIKSSLIMNGVFGLAIGLISYIKAKKES